MNFFWVLKYALTYRQQKVIRNLMSLTHSTIFCLRPGMNRQAVPNLYLTD